MEYRRTYDDTQLDPDELAELQAQRAAEARAQEVRDYGRRLVGSGYSRNGPRTHAELTRQRAERPPLDLPASGAVREHRAAAPAIGGHPQSRRNGSGFRGVRPRIRSFEARGD